MNPATHQDNMSHKRTKTSRFQGVSKNNNMWNAKLCFRSKRHYLGAFEDEITAACIYDHVGCRLQLPGIIVNLPDQVLGFPVNLSDQVLSGPFTSLQQTSEQTAYLKPVHCCPFRLLLEVRQSHASLRKTTMSSAH